MDDEDEYEDWDLNIPEEDSWDAASIANLAAHEAAILAPQTDEEIGQDAQIAEWLQGQVDVFVKDRANQSEDQKRVLALRLIEENLDDIEGEDRRGRRARAVRLLGIAVSLGRLDAVIEEGEDLRARLHEDDAETHPATSAA